MNSELIAQRKKAFLYNHDKHSLLVDVAAPLKTYFDIDLFAQEEVLLNSKGEAIEYKTLITNLGFLNSYIHGCDHDHTAKPFIQPIKEASLGSYSFFPWSDPNDCPFSQMLCQQFGFSRGLFVYKRYETYLKAWWFVGKESIGLSKREWECLYLLAKGKTCKGVAIVLSISPRTVESYLNQIKEKTGVSAKHKLIDHFLENNQSSL